MQTITNKSEQCDRMPTALSRSQTDALQDLMMLADVFFGADLSKEIFIPRIKPLIIGPSGVGKSFLIRLLINSRSPTLPLFRVTYGDWIVSGAKVSTPTIVQLAIFVEQHSHGVIHIDELDKVGHFSEASDWNRCVHLEIFNLLDGTPTPIDEYGDYSWSKTLQHKLRNNFLIVGSATFQHLFDCRPSAGFINKTNNIRQLREVMLQRIYKEKILPVELLERFNNNLIIINPITKEDGQQILNKIKQVSQFAKQLTPELIDILAEQAASTGHNMRFFEELLTKLIIQKKQQEYLIANEKI